jgi:hypothetical protein
LIGAIALAIKYADSQYRSFTELGVFLLVLIVVPIALYIAAHFVTFEIPGPGEEVQTDGETEFAAVQAQMAQFEKRRAGMLQPAILVADIGEPLHDADRRMADGNYTEAFALIESAINEEPTRSDLKLKLLEVLFVWGDSDRFLAFAKKFRGTLEDSNGWVRVRVMGAEICPNERMFS